MRETEKQREKQREREREREDEEICAARLTMTPTLGKITLENMN